MGSVLPQDPWSDLGEDLKWMGTTLGRLRDLDVLSDLFDAHLEAGAELREAITSRLDQRRAKRRHAVSELLDSSRYAHIVKSLSKLSDEPGLGDLGDVWASHAFLPPLWSATCTYLEAVGHSGERRSDEELHRVRIASKKCRYNFEVATLFLGEPARVVAAALEGIQDVLGKVQDRVVAVSFLDTIGVREEVDLALRRSLRAEIAELRPQWVAHFEVARVSMIDVFDQERTKG